MCYSDGELMPACLKNALVCVLIVMLSGADAPRIERVFPPGGQRGTTVKVKLVGTPGDRPVRVWSQADQLAVEIDSKEDAATIVIPPDATPGIHWLRFHNSAGATQLIPFDIGMVDEVSETEPNDSVSDANPIDQSSVIVNGTLSKSGEVDVFRIAVKANQTLVASMVANRLLGSPMDGVLQILNSDGVTLAQNDDDHSLDPQLTFTAKQDGAYFVRAFAFPSAPNSTIRLAGSASYVYRLTLTTDAFVDFALPASVDGSSETRVELHGWNLSASQKTAVVSPQRPASFVINTAKASPIEISRSAFSGVSESEASQQNELQPPFAVSGIITTVDESDSYLFTATKGQKLTIAAAARQSYSQLDPVLTLLDDRGKLLKESDDISRDNMDCSMAVSIPSDGVYTLRIRDRFDSGGSRHFYRLSCVDALPAVEASVESTVFSLRHNKPLTIPITVARTNGHKYPVTFSVAGLPAGIEVASATSEIKGDTAMKVDLKLELKNVQEQFSGPITIEGTSESGTISVTGRLPNSTRTSSSFWLTVVPEVPNPQPPEHNSDEGES